MLTTPGALDLPPVSDPAGDRALRRRGLTLALLTAAYFFSYMDRSIIPILQESIRHDLRLTDTQLGLIGTGFAVFYATLGIPVARRADRGRRVDIIAIALALWSVMTALGGLAQNFVQLLLARSGVGVGEAGSAAPSHSMIADLYPPEKRAGAMSIYTLGIVFGAAAGTIIGGALGHAYGWRVAMIAVGLPGVLLAVVIKLFVVEPRRGLSDPVQAGAPEAYPSLIAGIASMWRDPAVRHLIAGVTLISMIGYAHGQFGPSYLQRSLHLTKPQIYGIVAPVAALIATVSGLTGGYIANRLARTRGMHAQAWMIAIANGVGFFPYFVLYLAGSVTVAVGGYWIALLLVSTYLAPTFAMLQSRAPLRLRALWAAITLLCINLIGLGIGPPLIGIISDALHPAVGEESLRYAMIAMTCIGPWPIFHYWRAGVLMRRGDAVLPLGA